MSRSFSFSPSKHAKSLSNTLSTEETVIRPPAPNSEPIWSNQPFTDVSNLFPKQILPIEVIPSENPNVLYFFKKAFQANIRNEVSKAITMYKKVLASESNHYESLVNLGLSYAKLNQITEALNSFDCAIKNNPQVFLPYFNKALICISGKYFGKAVECMNLAGENIRNPPEELFKIRTFALFKDGKPFDALDREEKYKKIRKTTSSASTCEKTSREVQTRRHFTNAGRFEISKIFPEPEKITTVEESLCKIQHRRTFTPVIRKKTPSFDGRIQRTLGKKVNTRRPVSISAISPEVYGKNSGKIRWSLNRTPSYELNQFTKASNKQFKLSKLRVNDEEDLKNQGFTQKDLSKLNCKENVLKNEGEMNKRKSEIENLKISLEQYLIKEVNKELESNPSRLESIIFTQENLKFLITEFEKSENDRRYKKLDKLLKKIPFFQKSEKELRFCLYGLSSICQYSAGEVIFRQGDIGDRLYITLQGSIIVSRFDKAYGPYEVIVNSLYDYKHFGDIALINSLRSTPFTQRTASCTAQEPSYFLSIPKLHYQKLILTHLMPQIDIKTNFFSQLPLFKNIDLSLLAPLACHIQLKTFSLNDVIITKGEVPQGLYILFTGTCILYTQGKTIRKRYGSEFSNARIKKPKPLDFVGPGFPGVKVKEKIAKKCLVEKNQKIPLQEHSEKKSYNENDSYILQDEIAYAALQPKDFFGGRVLFEATNNLKSKFTLIAKSAKVEVFLITKEILANLSENIIFQVRTVIGKSFEVDCPDNVDAKELDLMFVNWQKFKKDCVENIRRKKFFERNKIHIMR